MLRGRPSAPYSLRCGYFFLCVANDPHVDSEAFAGIPFDLEAERLSPRHCLVGKGERRYSLQLCAPYSGRHRPPPQCARQGSRLRSPLAWDPWPLRDPPFGSPPKGRSRTAQKSWQASSTNPRKQYPRLDSALLSTGAGSQRNRLAGSRVLGAGLL